MASSKSIRVAVVGAGASGLAAIKCCLDEGLTPVCFERSAHIGGLWHYSDQESVDQTCVMKSTVINTSKELLAFSDFPMPAHYPNFIHNLQVEEYFHLYAQRFDLKRHINFETQVSSVSRAEEYSNTGQWAVSYRSLRTGEEWTEVFDAVMLGSGHQTYKHVPQFEGLVNFQGKVLHTNDYKKPAGFEDKKVLLVGIGNSAADCAVELSRVSKQVYISTRRGCWVVNRVGDNGYPRDLQKTTRFNQFMGKTFRRSYEKWTETEINRRFDHALYRLKPAHSLFAYPATLNDDLPNRIVTGSVKVKDDVKRFTETGAEFVDGTKEDFDAVILATGFRAGFTFLEEGVLRKEKSNFRLYKLVFPPDLEQSSLALIGCLQPSGPFFPMVEMQCRWATRVFRGLVKLPDSATMWSDIHRRDSAISRALIPTERYSTIAKYMPYVDEIAKLVGCYPDFGALMRTDPVLAWQLWFGPAYPFSYRLFGPGQWDGAREAILTAPNRVEKPFQTRSLPVALDNKPSQSLQRYLMYMILLAITTLLAAWPPSTFQLKGSD